MPPPFRFFSYRIVLLLRLSSRQFFASSNRNITTFRRLSDMKRVESYILITIVITSCLLSGCSKPNAAEIPPQPISPEQISAALNAAESAFKNRQDHESYRKAVTALENVRNPGQR